MWNFGIVFVVALTLVQSKAESSDLDQFFASGVKENDSGGMTEEQDQETSNTATTNELLHFMKRSGLFPETQHLDTDMNTGNNEARNQQLLATLQAISRQQNKLGYSQQYIPQNFVNAQQQAPGSISGLPTSNLVYQQQQAPLSTNSNPNLAYQQQQVPFSSNGNSNLASQQQQTASTSTSTKFNYPQQKASSANGKRSYQQQQVTNVNTKLDYPQEKETNTNSKLTYPLIQEGSKTTGDKTAAKADRQGSYDYESHGYDNSHVGNYGGYSGEHYVSEPAGYNGYNKNVHIPVPSVAIKLDPLGLLKLLLQGLPRPILNLNGKVFFGVELGKGVGIGIGKPTAYAPPYGGGGAKVITIG